MRYVLVFFLAALTVSGAGAADSHAEAKQQRRSAAARAARSDAAMEQMMRADVNKDGTVSRDEVERLDSRMSPQFKAADVDRDGRLTLREFERLRDLSRGATSGTAMRGSAAGSGPGATR